MAYLFDLDAAASFFLRDRCFSNLLDAFCGADTVLVTVSRLFKGIAELLILILLLHDVQVASA
jgi:hypothetical protein